VELDAKHHHAHTELGRIYNARGETSDARSHFESALQIEPNHTEAQTPLAMLLVQGSKADLQRALTMLESLAQNSTSAETFCALGFVRPPYVAAMTRRLGTTRRGP